MAFDSFPDPDDKEAQVRATRAKERRQIQGVLGAIAGSALAVLFFWPRKEQPEADLAPSAHYVQPAPEVPAVIRSVAVNTKEGAVKVALQTGVRALVLVEVRCEVRWSGVVEEFHVRRIRGSDHRGGLIPEGYSEILTFHFTARVVPQNVTCFLK